MPEERESLNVTTPSTGVPIYRITLVRESTVGESSSSPVRKSAEAAEVLRPIFTGLDREQFVVLMLDAQHRPIAINVVSVGSLTASIVHPRLCFAKHNLGYVAAPFMWSSAHRTPDFLQRVPFRRNISWPAWRRNASKEADYARQAIRNRICRRPAQSRAIRCCARAISEHRVQRPRLIPGRRSSGYRSTYVA